MLKMNNSNTFGRVINYFYKIFYLHFNVLFQVHIWLKLWE